jgi:hypothetical protein
MRKILIILVCTFLLASCGSTTVSPSEAGQATPDSAAPPGNFLWKGDTEAMFLAWVDNNGSLSGQTQDARIQTITPGNEQVSSTHGSFTGTLSSNQVNLDFGGFLGYANNITGTYDGTTLVLNFPTTSGTIGSLTFVPATPDDFNTAVGTLQTQVNNDQATASANQATADAANAQAAALAGQQQAVANANTTVHDDLASIQGDIASLNQSTTFDSVFSAYAKDWQHMQNDYQTEVNDSKKGCGSGNYNYGTVQYDAGSVNYDLGSIQYDDGSYDHQKNGIDRPYSGVQQDIAALKNDWKTLQQAVAYNSSGSPGSNYQQSDIDNAIGSGNNALSTAVSAIQKAKQERAIYDNEATNLNNQAQALPGKMGC